MSDGKDERRPLHRNGAHDDGEDVSARIAARRGRWLSSQAVLWVMDEAPGVPAHLFAALVAIARYTDENGRGAYPSTSTIAAITRKGERRTKRDLAELRQLGLLLPGDQQLVKDIRPDKRPSVYDLAMPRGVSQDTPLNGHGVSHRTGRGGRQGSSGVVERTPKELLKSSGTGARPDADAPRANPPGPPWCGWCDEDTRLDERDEDHPRRCARCHPAIARERQKLIDSITYTEARALAIDRPETFKTALANPLATYAGCGTWQYRAAAALILREDSQP